MLIQGWEKSEGTLAEIARAEQMRLPVFRGLHLLPSAEEFVAFLFAYEARQA
ncbi:hypothetical protein D3C84_1245350 [compost metagenome]